METYRCEYVKCGKDRCKTCPHGPYWYGYFRAAGKLKKHYYGRMRPKEALLPKTKADWREAIFSKATASTELAWRILGLVEDVGQAAVKKRFRELTFSSHPDRGGSEKEYKYITAAYSYLCSVFRW